MDAEMRNWFLVYDQWMQSNFDVLGRGALKSVPHKSRKKDRKTGKAIKTLRDANNQCDPKEAFMFILEQWFASFGSQFGQAV